MRWQPGRGLIVVAIVLVGLSVLVVAGRMLAPRLGESPVRSKAPPPSGTIRIVPLTDVPSEPPIPWSTVPAAPSGKPAQLTGGGVRLRLPGGWHGRTSSEGGLRILQAANFVLATQDRGEDPIQAMTLGQVVVTLSTGTGCCPGTPVSASPVIGASDFVRRRPGPGGSGVCREGRPHPRQHPLHRGAVRGPTAGGVAAAADQPAAGLVDCDLARLVWLRVTRTRSHSVGRTHTAATRRRGSAGSRGGQRP